MRINKKISALLCSVAMCCSNGQVSKTSASLLGYFFSVAAVQQWILTASYYYARFKVTKGGSGTSDVWLLPYFVPGNSNQDAYQGLKQVAKSLSRLDNLPIPVLLTYLAREEFRKEKENNKRVQNENMYVDPKNSKDKKSDTNK
jgi:hypothetical protein